MTATSLPINARLIAYHLAARTDPAQVILPPGKVMRLPGDAQMVRVLAGQAWITQAGRDIVLATGEMCLLMPDRNGALVSPVGDLKLIMEIRSES